MDTRISVLEGTVNAEVYDLRTCEITLCFAGSFFTGTG